MYPKKTQYVIIAGPQAAGKSTLLQSLSREHPKTRALEETRHIIKKKYNLLGAISMTRELEFEVIDEDLKRMCELESVMREEQIDLCLDECNVLTLAHAMTHGISTQKPLKEYSLLLKQLGASVIFLDVAPEISWQRRHEKYAQRLRETSEESDYEKEKMMGEYQTYMNRVYPLLISTFRKLNVPKVRFDASLPQREVLADVRRHIIKHN